MDLRWPGSKKVATGSDMKGRGTVSTKGSDGRQAMSLSYHVRLCATGMVLYLSTDRCVFMTTVSIATRCPDTKWISRILNPSLVLEAHPFLAVGFGDMGEGLPRGPAGHGDREKKERDCSSLFLLMTQKRKRRVNEIRVALNADVLQTPE